MSSQSMVGSEHLLTSDKGYILISGAKAKVDRLPGLVPYDPSQGHTLGRGVGMTIEGRGTS